MRKVVIAFAVALLLAIAWYLISPLWRVIEVDEPSPIATTTQPASSVATVEDETDPEPAEPSNPAVKDELDTMDKSTKAEFEAEVEAMKDEVVSIEETMPPAARIVAQGTFQPRAHDVQGTAQLIEQDGNSILRFENFETINGPDVRIYLASDLSADDFVDLGKIRATKGNVNYEVSSDIDTTRYNKVLVWCVAFSVLFSYAELS